MKKKGSYCDFTRRRDEELLAAFRRCIRQMPCISLPSLLRQVVSQPCSRFWVSPERATAILTRMFQGQDVSATMRPPKREMYRELFRRAQRIRALFPTMSIAHIAARAVYSPAPQFYIAPAAAKIYLHYIIKEKRKGK